MVPKRVNVRWQLEGSHFRRRRSIRWWKMWLAQSPWRLDGSWHLLAAGRGIFSPPWCFKISPSNSTIQWSIIKNLNYNCSSDALKKHSPSFDEPQNFFDQALCDGGSMEQTRDCSGSTSGVERLRRSPGSGSKNLGSWGISGIWDLLKDSKDHKRRAWLRSSS